MSYGAEKRLQTLVLVMNGNEKIWSKYGKKSKQRINDTFSNLLLEYMWAYTNQDKISCDYFLLRAHIPIPERVIVL